MNEHNTTFNPQSSTHQHNFSNFFCRYTVLRHSTHKCLSFMRIICVILILTCLLCKKVETRFYHSLYLESPALRCLQKNTVRRHSWIKCVNWKHHNSYAMRNFLAFFSLKETYFVKNQKRTIWFELQDVKALCKSAIHFILLHNIVNSYQSCGTKRKTTSPDSLPALCVVKHTASRRSYGSLL